MPKRYPGSQPFQREQSPIFFGREDDIARLHTTIQVGGLTVLHGKSGLGKTSLLNAGVVPHFRAGTMPGTTTENPKTGPRFQTIFPRFFAADHESHTDPLAEIRHQFLTSSPESSTFFAEIESRRDHLSLWQIAKSIERQHKKQASGLLIVFDQFEELFSYPQAKVEAFAIQFAELAMNRMPEIFQQKLYARMADDPDFMEKHAPELSMLEETPALKIVIGIRSDWVSYLDRLSHLLPGKLQNRMELLPLSRAQAREAIVRPAVLQGVFDSPKFSYEAQALDNILDYLTTNGSKPVEATTQLQVICQFAENLVKAENQTIRASDLGDIKAIIRNQYANILLSFDKKDRENIQKMIEEGLIFEPEERRLSLSLRQIGSTYAIEQPLLDELADKHHLLRKEPIAAGGALYEISHDALVKPILAAKKERLDREAEIEAQRQRKLGEIEREKQQQAELETEKQLRIRRERRLFLAIISLTIPGILITSWLFWRSFNQSKEINAANAELQKTNATAIYNYDWAKKQADSLRQLSAQLASTNRLMLDAFFARHLEKGEFYLKQREYKLAKDELRRALEFFPEGRGDRQEIQLKIVEAEVGQRKREEFEGLINRADSLMNEKQFLQAFPFYQKADSLRYDENKIRDKIRLCRKELEIALHEDIRRAEIFLKQGARGESQCKQILKFDINPVLSALGMNADDELSKRRDAISRAFK